MRIASRGVRGVRCQRGPRHPGQEISPTRLAAGDEVLRELVRSKKRLWRGQSPRTSRSRAAVAWQVLQPGEEIIHHVGPAESRRVLYGRCPPVVSASNARPIFQQ